MKKFAYIISMVFSLFLATACDDNDGPNDGPIEPVTEVRAESFIGSVNVYFKAPQNENYYYTLITYDDSEGKTKHLKVGKDALDSETGLMKAVVTGFTDTDVHNFQLQACTAHGSISTPVAVTGKAESRSEAKNYVLNSVTMYPGENCAVINWQNVTGVPVTLDIAYYRNGVPVIVTRDATSGGSVSVEITEPTTIYYQTYNTGDDQDKSEAKSMDITPIPCPYDIIDPNVEYITLTKAWNQMSWVADPDTPDNPYAYYITSTGGDPFCNANGLKAAAAGTKLVMRYKANKAFILELFWCDNGGGAAGGRSTTVNVPQSDGWSTFIYDYADAMSQHNWKGNAGDFFRMDWGTEPGLEIHVKNMHLEK
ncbi:MAG: DUF4959 domain-containing protein [Prevotella sp.]|nr:DUF4959 domain-containing protein [Prevotella sp.]